MIAVSACFTFTHCSDDKPTQPPDTLKPPDTTSHEFVWEVDTLFFEGTSIPVYFKAKAFYIANDTNVFLVGYSTGGSEMCWHWNGKNWSVFNLSPYLGREVAGIDGIDSSFIVFLGYDPGVSKFTGIMAYEDGVLHTIPLPNGNRPRTCLEVVSRNEIYIGGVEGIQRFDGTEWTWMLDSTDSNGNEFYPQYIKKFDDGELEMVSLQQQSNQTSRLVQWKYTNSSFFFVDSYSLDETNQNNARFGHAISSGATDVYSIGLGGVFRYQGYKWNRFRTEIGGFITGYDNDLFWGQGMYYVWHYNGSTTSNLWNDVISSAPGFRIVYAMAYSGRSLYICGMNETTKVALIIRARQIAR